MFFSHPDYTVGFGISPNQPPKRVADYTAGREFQSEAALITLPRRNFLFMQSIITLYRADFNSKSSFVCIFCHSRRSGSSRIYFINSSFNQNFFSFKCKSIAPDMLFTNSFCNKLFCILFLFNLFQRHLSCFFQ